ncbi:MAG: zinc ribbon domain-containing protein [Cyanobacteria bacterium]|nr:zinc ribbon domain-containing protein [Cyanobacteriota bacterium]MCL5020036.1 zinc ribbon domain-containing protein [Patescibacteria group bacterium]
MPDTIDLNEKCPKCHAGLPSNSFFCFNCGKKIKDKPLSTSIPRQMFVYFLSFFLTPMGFSYGFKYFRQPGAAKIIGVICIALSSAALVIAILVVVSLFSTINSVMNGGQINNGIINGGVNSEINSQFQNQLKDLQKIKEFEKSGY